MSVSDQHDLDPERESLRALQLRLALLKYLSDATKERYDEARREMRARSDEGQAFRPAIETGDPLDVGAVSVATISHVRARRTLTVVDQAAFSAWLLSEHPDEAVTRASENFWSRLRDLAKRAGGRVCGPQGESEIPGLAMVLGGDYVSVRPVYDMMPVLYGQLRDQLPKILEGRTDDRH